MKKARRDTACVVFEGRIVVSGGYSSVDSQILNTVEVYDVFADEWSTMTSLNRRRRWHQMVVVRDKLFVIGGRINSCEVFDRTCKKFVEFNSPGVIRYNLLVAIGEKKLYI